MNDTEKEYFKHSIKLKVQFHQVDLLGVCNNAVYFNFFETARIEYIKEIGQYRDTDNLINGKTFFLIARNACDYIEPAFFDDELTIYTRVKFIKNSSFGFEHIVEKVTTGRILAKADGVVVHIDRSTNKSLPLPEEFYTAVKNYEKSVQILKENNSN